MNVLVIFPGPEPTWADAPAACRARFPDLAFSFAVGVGEAEALAAEADAIIAFGVSEAVAERADRLKWIQAMGAGADHLTGIKALRPHVVITGVEGLHGAAVSEAALSMMFMFSRGLAQVVRNQAQARWAPSVSRLLDGRVVGIVGVGAIAACLAVRCKALGMTVIGVSESPRPVAGFDRVRPRMELVQAVADFDFVVLLAAHTPATAGMIDADVLRAMKPDAVLVNVGRGALVDEAALIAALEAGSIGGAALDVFAQEPLPADSPLWTLPNVLVLPHNAGRREGYFDAVLDVFAANLPAFRAGDLSAMRPRIARRG